MFGCRGVQKSCGTCHTVPTHTICSRSPASSMADSHKGREGTQSPCLPTSGLKESQHELQTAGCCPAKDCTAPMTRPAPPHLQPAGTALYAVLHRAWDVESLLCMPTLKRNRDASPKITKRRKICFFFG